LARAAESRALKIRPLAPRRARNKLAYPNRDNFNEWQALILENLRHVFSIDRRYASIFGKSSIDRGMP
jgi:hypothetical protein